MSAAYGTIFSLRRDVETGKLMLDSFMQVASGEVQERQQVENAIGALEGREPANLMRGYEVKAAMLKLRAAFDGAIIGTFGFNTPVEYTRDTFWQAHKKWSLKKFREYRI